MAPTPDLSSEPWLSSVLSNTHHSPSPSPLLIVSSDSHSLSPLPIVKHFINQATPSHPVLLISALIPPKKLGVEKGRSVEVLDLTSEVPGYREEGELDEDKGGLQDVEKRVRAIVKKLNSPLTIIIDSPPTLTSNFNSSPSLFILFVNRILTLLTSLGPPSLLVLPLPPQSPLLSLLSHPSQTHLALTPPTLLHHLQQTYNFLPPTPKWYTLARSVLEREEFEEGGDQSRRGCVVVLTGRGKKVRRGVEGLLWNGGEGGKGGGAGLRVVEWDDQQLGGGLSELKKKEREGEKLPPTAHSSSSTNNPSNRTSSSSTSTPLSTFNLSLTTSQRESRSAVPLPYAHEGDDPHATNGPDDDDDDDDEGARGEKAASGFAFGKPGGGGIYYEPDEGDDMDEDDPDEDLEF